MALRMMKRVETKQKVPATGLIFYRRDKGVRITSYNVCYTKLLRIQILATPVLGITVALLFAERVIGTGLFDPAQGGDPIMFQHLFWIYSHPAVYIMVLPGMGVVSDIVPVFARKPAFGYKAIVISSLAIAFAGSLVWAHHMYTSGMSDFAVMVFSFLTFIVAIPSAIKVV